MSEHHDDTYAANLLNTPPRRVPDYWAAATVAAYNSAHWYAIGRRDEHRANGTTTVPYVDPDRFAHYWGSLWYAAWPDPNLPDLMTAYAELAERAATTKD